MTEGVYNKVAGDILYASEANYFNRIMGSPVYQAPGSMCISGGDGANILLGSWVFYNVSGTIAANFMFEMYGPGCAPNIYMSGTLSPKMNLYGPPSNYNAAWDCLPVRLVNFTAPIGGTFDNKVYAAVFVGAGGGGSQILKNVKIFCGGQGVVVSGNF